MRFCMGIKTLANSILLMRSKRKRTGRGTYKVHVWCVMRFMWQHKRVFCIPIVSRTQFHEQKFYLENCSAFLACEVYSNFTRSTGIHVRIKGDGNFVKQKQQQKLLLLCVYDLFFPHHLTFISLMRTIPLIASASQQRMIKRSEKNFIIEMDR